MDRDAGSPLAKCFVHMYIFVWTILTWLRRVWMLTDRSHKVFRKRMRIFRGIPANFSISRTICPRGRRALSRGSLYAVAPDAEIDRRSLPLVVVVSPRPPIWLCELIRNIVNSSSLSLLLVKPFACHRILLAERRRALSLFGTSSSWDHYWVFAANEWR